MYDMVSAEIDTDPAISAVLAAAGGETMNHFTFPPSFADSMAVISPTPPGGEITTMLLLLTLPTPLTFSDDDDDDATREISDDDGCVKKASLDSTRKARTATMRRIIVIANAQKEVRVECECGGAEGAGCGGLTCCVATIESTCRSVMLVPKRAQGQICAFFPGAVVWGYD